MCERCCGKLGFAILWSPKFLCFSPKCRFSLSFSAGISLFFLIVASIAMNWQVVASFSASQGNAKIPKCPRGQKPQLITDSMEARYTCVPDGQPTLVTRPTPKATPKPTPKPNPLPTPTPLSATAREWVLREAKARPNDPWPQGKAHVLLGIPGSPEKEKGYLEPGGSFSPAVGSFGISFWMTDLKGNLVASSDTIESGQQHTHQWVGLESSRTPGIKTSYASKYDATWTPVGAGKWALDLQTTASNTAKIFFVVRSVGPAGGRVDALKWDGNNLLVNDRWSINFGRLVPDTAVRVGQEGDKDWKTALLREKDRRFKDGWGFATIDLSADKNWKVEITDKTASSVPAFTYNTLRSNLEIFVNSAEFNASLNAQVAHLLMGITRKEVWPGDPLSYGKKRSREAAYTIVALMRAGHIEIAKELLTELAERYTWGATDAETTGLFLWAADEVTAKLIQREPDNVYAFKLWTQVKQKADELTAARIAQVSTGQMGALYMQALNYRGLLGAANYAERMRKMDEANRYRNRAAEWKQAWDTDYKTQIFNDSPYYSGLWPSGVTSATRDFTQGLETRWKIAHNSEGGFQQAPTRPSLAFADAHQWLMLENSDRPWQTLQWFWQHQTMPGLYFWSSQNEENPGKNWEQVRGWVNAPTTSTMPHYWTAAELLLLQLDMLAYVDDTTREPALVIGAGLHPDWVNLPMNVNGILTNFGEISWDWNAKDKRLTILVANKQTKDRLNKNKDRLVRVGAALRAVMKGKPEIKQS